MRIIVTGGSGFIGSAFIRAALKCKHEIINIDSLTYAASQSNLKSVENDPNYHFEKKDIRDKKEINRILKYYKPDKLIHLAAESHVDRSIDAAVEVLSTNIIGTFVLLDTFTKYWIEMGKPKDFRFHHVSTDEVFGNVNDGKRFTEETRYNPKNPYSASKASSDHLVRAWANTHGLPIIITNCSNNYGPFQFPEKLIPMTILNILNNKTIPIYGNGEQIRDWIHVNDHVDALLMILNDPKDSITYNIGTNGELTNIKLVKRLCNILNEKLEPTQSFHNLIKFVSDRPGHDTHYGIDAKKLYKNYKWKPKYTLDMGIESTVTWYLDNQTWLDELEDRDGVGVRLGDGYL
jgi:dTDP-glucose 4,6-dehydratase